MYVCDRCRKRFKRNPYLIVKCSCSLCRNITMHQMRADGIDTNPETMENSFGEEGRIIRKRCRRCRDKGVPPTLSYQTLVYPTKNRTIF